MAFISNSCSIVLFYIRANDLLVFHGTIDRRPWPIGPSCQTEHFLKFHPQISFFCSSFLLVCSSETGLSCASWGFPSGSVGFSDRFDSPSCGITEDGFAAPVALDPSPLSSGATPDDSIGVTCGGVSGTGGAETISIFVTLSSS